MIRNLLATTAIATLLASGALAQTTTPPAADPSATTDQQTPMTVRAEGHLASELIGEAVYNGTGEDAERIGDVTDLVVTGDGNVEALVVGVGGFLGIGQKEVALEYDLAEWSEQQDGERWLVIETTREALEAQEEFDRAAYRPMPADAQVSETQPATADDLSAAPAGEGGSDDTAAAPTDDQSGESTAAAPADEGADTGSGVAVVPTPSEPTDETAAAPADQGTDTGAGATDDMAAGEQATPDTQTGQDTAQAPDGEAAGTDETTTGAIDPSTMQQAQPDQIRAENLTGTAVYGTNEERVGEIGDVILTPEGDVDAVIVDVGGFLGVGEKEVAIGMDNLSFMTDEGGELYLFTEFTQEELEAAPEYDEATYAEQRDDMRLQVQ